VTMTIAAFEAYKKAAGHTSQPADFVAGLSLGEYSALVAAEAMRFEDAVYIVRRRGEFMEQEALRSPGKMASIIGLDINAVHKVCQEAQVEVANINSLEQIVISGAADKIDKAVIIAQNAGAKRVIVLDVSGAFHSSLMKPASVKLAAELDKVAITAPKVPVISNVTSEPTVDPAKIRENLVKQVASSVLWEASMRHCIASGVNRCFEFGPGKVLKGLMRRIDANVQVSTVEKKGDMDEA
jgi:[acyl-carrier-protein] S-malonyltransferase